MQAASAAAAWTLFFRLINFADSQTRAYALHCLLTQAGRSLIYLVVFFVTFSYSEGKSLTCHFIAFQILIVGSDLVYQAAIWLDLDDTVGSGLYELVVMAGEQCHTGELDQTVVQRGDGLHVQMVSGLIQDQTVGAADHHLG